MKWEVQSFESNAELSVQLSTRIGHCLSDVIKNRGAATLAVSGGRTPVLLFENLATMKLDWSKITVTLVDERWVPLDHPDSNAGLVSEKLLQGVASRARFFGLTNDAESAFEAEKAINTRLSNLDLPIDVVVLGMGEDGHTASFFPGALGLDKALDPPPHLRCCAIRPTAAAHERMTLTLPLLVQSPNLFLHLCGVAKWQVLEQAMDVDAEPQFPISTVLRQAPHLAIYYTPE